VALLGDMSAKLDGGKRWHERQAGRREAVREPPTVGVVGGKTGGCHRRTKVTKTWWEAGSVPLRSVHSGQFTVTVKRES